MAYIRNSPTTGLPFTSVFPPPIYEKRNPTKHDSQNYPLGQEWINTVDLLSWELMSLELEAVTNIQVATWVLMGNSALGSVTALQADDTNLANPLGGIISVSGFHNINTTADGVNTLTVAMNNQIVLGDLAPLPIGAPAVQLDTGDLRVLAGSISVPPTTQNEGWYYIGTRPFMGAPFHISNTLVGARPVGPLLLTGINNSAFGAAALNALATGQGNTALGHFALQPLGAGNYNTAVGISAGLGVAGAETANIYLGAFAGAIGNVGENRTTRIGADPADPRSPLRCFVQGVANVVVANQNIVTVDTTTGQLGGSHSIDNFAQQFNANTGGLATPIFGILNIFGGHNVTTDAGGDTVTVSNTNTSSWGDLAPLAAGQNAVNAVTGDIKITSGNLNIESYTNPTSTTGCIFSAGSRFLSHIPTAFGDGTANIGLGDNALNLAIDITAHANVAIGRLSLGSVIYSRGNIAVGPGTLALFVGTLGDDTSGRSVALGANALKNATNCKYMVSIGDENASLYTGNEANNITIGAFTQGVTGESNVIRIGTITQINAGTPAPHTSCIIGGISGQTSPGGVGVLVNASGKLGTIVSSRRYKEDIQPIDSNLSKKILNLKPVSFKYINDVGPDKPINYGLTAEDVNEHLQEMCIYNEKGDPEAVAYHILPIFLLEEFKRQQSEIECLRKELVLLKKKLYS